jgi:L-lactate dehydrogenase complex protein LldG
MTGDARTAILDRITRALRTARIPSTTDGDRFVGDPEKVALHRKDVGPSFQGGLQERFLLEARALGVEAFDEPSADAVRRRLAAVVDGLEVLSWNGDRLPYDGSAVIPGATLGTAPIRQQAHAGVGVTGCHAAIAETGSLVLLSGPGTARTVSLLPPLHVALVRPDDLVPTMAEYFAINPRQLAGASSCTIVTGPSRSGDIEMSLTIGVHGPGRIVVIIGP